MPPLRFRLHPPYLGACPYLPNLRYSNDAPDGPTCVQSLLPILLTIYCLPVFVVCPLHLLALWGCDGCVNCLTVGLASSVATVKRCPIERWPSLLTTEYYYYKV